MAETSEADLMLENKGKHLSYIVSASIEPIDTKKIKPLRCRDAACSVRITNKIRNKADAARSVPTCI